MTAHELAAKLLEGPDLPMAIYDGEYGEYFFMLDGPELCEVTYKDAPYSKIRHQKNCVGLK